MDITLTPNTIENYLKDFQILKDGNYEMSPNIFGEDCFQLICQEYKYVKEYYLQLGSKITLLSFEPQNTPQSYQIYKIATLLYCSHWLIDDIFDKHKDEITDSKFTTEGLQLYLKMIETKCVPDYQYLSDCVKNKNLIITMKTTSVLFLDIINLMSQLLGEKASTIIFNHYINAVSIFLSKTKLNTRNTSSINDYTENRKFSTGCIPYMNLQYFMYGFESNISPREIVDFLEKYHSEIKTLEENSNIISGFYDDMMAIVKDKFEDVANIVYVLQNLHPDQDIYQCVELSHGIIEDYISQLNYRLTSLEKNVDSCELPILNIIRKSLVKNIYGVIYFRFHVKKRYLLDNELVIIYNSTQENKKKLFLQKYNNFINRTIESPLI